MKLENITRVGKGSRVSVYVFPEKLADTPDKMRVLRVPYDQERHSDNAEFFDFQEIRMFLNESFFPDPQIHKIELDGRKRRLISCSLIISPYLQTIPKAKIFGEHLDNNLPNYSDKLLFLRNLRQFVEECKNAYYWRAGLPDLRGKGNVIPHETSVLLLDFNNISSDIGKIVEGGEIHVPLDTRGIPVFDLSLMFLYDLEKRILSFASNNFSTQSFARVTKAEGVSPSYLHSTNIFRDRTNLVDEPFYGALKVRGRRDAVKNFVKSGYFH